MVNHFLLNLWIISSLDHCENWGPIKMFVQVPHGSGNLGNSWWNDSLALSRHIVTGNNRVLEIVDDEEVKRHLDWHWWPGMDMIKTSVCAYVGPISSKKTKEAYLLLHSYCLCWFFVQLPCLELPISYCGKKDRTISLLATAMCLKASVWR